MTSNERLADDICTILRTCRSRLDTFRFVSDQDVATVDAVRDDLAEIEALLVKTSSADVSARLVRRARFFAMFERHAGDASLPVAPGYRRVLITGFAERPKLKELLVAIYGNGSRVLPGQIYAVYVCPIPGQHDAELVFTHSQRARHFVETYEMEGFECGSDILRPHLDDGYQNGLPLNHLNKLQLAKITRMLTIWKPISELPDEFVQA